MPTLYMGTERERPDWMLESLGFRKGDWVVGMDFPTATWKSHYYQEHLFGLVVASTLEMLISQGYRAIVHRERSRGVEPAGDPRTAGSKHYTPHDGRRGGVEACRDAPDVSEKNLAGHADLVETSLMLHYEKSVFGGPDDRGSAVRFPRVPCRSTTRTSPSSTAPGSARNRVPTASS